MSEATSPVDSDFRDGSYKRYLRAPFFWLSLLISFLPVFFIFAWVSVSSWCEDAIRVIGYREKPRWLPPILGLIGYIGLGIIGPAMLARLLLGWVGYVFGPLLALGVIAVLGRW